MLAVRNDDELDSLLRNVMIPQAGVMPNIHTKLLAGKNKKGGDKALPKLLSRKKKKGGDKDVPKGEKKRSL